jgi:hypothetical protein
MTRNGRPDQSRTPDRSSSGSQSRHSNRLVDQAFAPRPAESIADDHRATAERRTNSSGRCVGIHRQRGGEMLARHIRLIHSGVCSDEAVPRSILTMRPGLSAPACLDEIRRRRSICHRRNQTMAGRSSSRRQSCPKNQVRSGQVGFHLRKNCGDLGSGQKLADSADAERAPLARPRENQNCTRHFARSEALS